MADECMITRKTIPTHDWALPYRNSELNADRMKDPAIAIIGAVSREKGFELLMTFPKSINISKYKIFLEELRRR